MQLISSFTKAKRAQSVDDFETWIAGGVVPTLNAMDNNGEAFATVLILMEQGVPVIMRNREGCAGGGKGPMYSEKSFTLATSNDQILIIDGTRVNDVRVYEDGIVPTVISRYGTGGGNVPMIFGHTQGMDVQASESASPTLRANGNGAAVVYPIDDAREIEKHQNGTGIGDDGAPAYTLDRQQVPGVVSVDFYNASIGTISQTLTSNSPTNSNIGGMMDSSVVRRLTPMECERLQGFPDGWTDGQADSSRYKQMGNAVAVPVVQWIINRMVEAISD